MIIAGKLSRLAQLERAKSEAFDVWFHSSPEKQQITRISRSLDRNQRLYMAAQNGVSLAIDKYNEIRNLSENFVRYMSDGQRDSTSVSGGQRLNQSR